MKHPVLTALWIGIGFTLYFCFGIGRYDLFDWDEINFAECAREMLNSNNFLKVQLYYKPFWEKPPLYIWMQAMSMKLFGVNAFAARFPNALCGGISMGLIYLWGIRYNRLVWAILWMLLLSCCLLPVMYFKSGIIDPWFNLFIISACFVYIARPMGYKNALLSGLLIGLAVLTKGPVALLLFFTGTTVYQLYNKNFGYFFKASFWILCGSALIFPLLWMGSLVLQNESQTLVSFFNYQIRLLKTEDSGHGGPWFFHPLVLLLGCFPASLFIFFKLENTTQDAYIKQSIRFMYILLITVVTVFSIVQTKIIHYSSLVYIPLCFIAGYKLQSVKKDHTKIWNFFYWTIAVVIFSILVSLALFPAWKNLLLQFVPKGTLEFERLQKNYSLPVLAMISSLVCIILISLLFNYILKKQQQKILYTMAGLGLAIHVYLLSALPMIGFYSQEDLIDLIKKYSPGTMLETHGFKSYAPLFYGNAQFQDFNSKQRLQEIERIESRLLDSGIDPRVSSGLIHMIWLEEQNQLQKPVYIIAKQGGGLDLKNNKGFKLIEKRSGYWVYQKKTPDI